MSDTITERTEFPKLTRVENELDFIRIVRSGHNHPRHTLDEHTQLLRREEELVDQLTAIRLTMTPKEILRARELRQKDLTRKTWQQLAIYSAVTIFILVLFVAALIWIVR